MSDVKELKDSDLHKVSGGRIDFKDSCGEKYEGYNVVDYFWGCPCRKHGYNPPCEATFMFGYICGQCKNYRKLEIPIHGWDGYCKWEESK